MLAKPAPNTKRHDIPPSWHAFAEFIIKQRCLHRPPALGGDAKETTPVQGIDGHLEHEVEAILQFRMRAGSPYVLVRLKGLGASNDTQSPLRI